MWSIQRRMFICILSLKISKKLTIGKVHMVDKVWCITPYTFQASHSCTTQFGSHNLTHHLWSWDSDDVVAAVAVAGAPPPHWPWCCWQSWWWGYWPKTLASELLSASLETQTWWNVSIVIEVTKIVFLDTGDVSSVVTKERLNVNTGDQFYKCSGPLNGFLASDWSVVTLPPADLPSLKAFQVSVTHFWVTPPRTPAWALSLNLHP